MKQWGNKMDGTDKKNLWACLCAGDILLRREGDTLSLPVGDEPPVALQPWNQVTTIGPLDNGKDKQDANECDVKSKVQGKDKSSSRHILRVIRLDRPVIDIPGLEMMPLRASFDVLTSEEYALAGKAAELIYWDSNTKYCGCCGAPMKFHTEISKRCTNCGKEVWPQLATAVIVRVTKDPSPALTVREGAVTLDDKDSLLSMQSTLSFTGRAEGGSILLVRANNFRRPYFGLVAGFVETGETLEEAVRREVREETGIEITDIRYFASQPWPFPCGLMVGFTARYASGNIHLQRSELNDGGWFTRDNLPDIPGKSSIARRLIDDWLKA